LYNRWYIPFVLTPALGTRLRLLLDAMDDDVALALSDLGLRDYRTRYSAVIRAVAEAGPMPIRDIAEGLGVTHSAVSQLVGEMQQRGLLETRPGTDARQRLVHLTARTRELLPAIDAEWTATETAAAALDAELPYSLSALIDDLAAALEQRRFRDRIAEAAEHVVADPALRAVLAARP
jgi:DNA-binding MarR family transcriptional regulator